MIEVKIFFFCVLKAVTERLRSTACSVCPQKQICDYRHQHEV